MSTGAASQFLSQLVFVGAVGYAYKQLTADSGQPVIFGDNKSQVFGIGPQVGFLFPANGMQGVLNIKGYYEFEAENRRRLERLGRVCLLANGEAKTAAEPTRYEVIQVTVVVIAFRIADLR